MAKMEKTSGLAIRVGKSIMAKTFEILILAIKTKKNTRKKILKGYPERESRERIQRRNLERKFGKRVITNQ
ncbi:MAG: hypothetical protein K6G22_08055 [Lachnospiraceae bacterium]|nr:hypothetical protein [Lachnospiraceae bacterium]